METDGFILKWIIILKISCLWPKNLGSNYDESNWMGKPVEGGTGAQKWEGSCHIRLLFVSYDNVEMWHDLKKSLKVSYDNVDVIKSVIWLEHIESVIWHEEDIESVMWLALINPIYLPEYLPTHLPEYLPTHLHIYLNGEAGGSVVE